VLGADFLAARPELVDIAFHDVCLRTNPRMPLLGELEELLRAAYYGTPVVTLPELEVTGQ
jgi:acetaldehyde dehydrogenase / alcohol dehydrogenase